MKKQSTTKSRRVVNYYLTHVSHYKWLRFGALVAVPLTVLTNSYLPALIAANVLSRLGQHDYTDNIAQSFGPQLLAYFGLSIAGMFTWRIVDYFMWRLEGRIMRDIAQEVFDHMLTESADFHANNFSGSLVSQTNKLIGGYVRLADTTVFQVLPLMTGLVLTVIILTPRAPLYVVLLLLFATIFILVALKISRSVQKLSAAHAAKESAQTGYLADAISNVMAIKSFARDGYERQRYAVATTDTYKSLMRFARGQQKQQNSMGSISRTISGLSLAMAVISVILFKSDLGTVFLILSYTGTIVDQLFQFSNNSLRNYSRSIGDASDMVEILSKQPEILDPANPEPSHIVKGSIDFNNVTFAHSGSDDAIFENLNIAIKHGQKVGLVGHSGSGKTTFTRLLLRFSDLDSGEILVDGQNIAKITQNDLHSNIAYVPQESLLFHRTIFENIAYGKSDATVEDVQLAATRANASEFIDRLPKGYDTLVGERGVKLSGGQRQRVAIARAMLKNAPILVLDEATSALDSESEVLIQDALWKLMEGRTAIVIAHRLSTIQKMDRIVVLNEGAIVEQGSHKQLLAKHGTYAKLWAHQSGGFMED